MTRRPDDPPLEGSRTDGAPGDQTPARAPAAPNSAGGPRGLEQGGLEQGVPVLGSAADYRARSDQLLAAAALAPPAEAAALQAEALQWRKLAVQADWQDAMRTALDNVARPTD